MKKKEKKKKKREEVEQRRLDGAELVSKKKKKKKKKLITSLIGENLTWQSDKQNTDKRSSFIAIFNFARDFSNCYYITVKIMDIWTQMPTEY